ncbi:phage baseplate plug family protein [Bartonella tamiae]|uniref:Cyanophage baseplate Pam3 plug gp18 domain-containing protein n=1 Tax=Bartonella tamiae Th239 TaxID=1094558 RepID=J0ZL39_9HYPH|nr:hypothetical protein [Bartonella tamiae]EJF89118.1 hypothetical protein ME5_01669 [Bartonella tamiae Th239]EJF95479.1 hypothetical protein MEG_00212 [Bartonella tamiae Th307]
MRTINLISVPAQTFSLRLDNKRFRLRINEGLGTMLADIDVDGTKIINATRILAGQPLIPYQWLEHGNFIMLTEKGDLPDWHLFNKDQTLIYLTKEEMADFYHG